MGPHTGTMASTLFHVTAVWLLMAGCCAAQQRPLITEDPETIGTGRLLVEGGLDYRWDHTFPGSGLTGDLWRAPVLGVSVGLGSSAEFQIDGGYSRLAVSDRRPAPLGSVVTTTGDTTSSFEDLVVATKIRVLAEQPGRPAFGVRFATRLPNATNESGLGLDTTDFFASLLVAKTVASVRIVGNVGLGILADPTVATQQIDVLTYGASFARALTDHAEVVGDVHGHVSTRTSEPPAGTGSRSQLRVGARYTVGSGRVDAAALLGLTTDEPTFGVIAGYTHVFNAFRVP